LCLHFPIEATDARRVLAEVELAVARGGADIDARARVGAGDANGDVVGKAQQQRLIGGLDGAGATGLGGRRLGGSDPPLEFAHGLLDEFEGFFRRALERNAAQIRVGGLLQKGNRLTRIGGGLGTGGALRRQGLEARWRRQVGRDVVDPRQLEQRRHVG